MAPARVSGTGAWLGAVLGVLSVLGAGSIEGRHWAALAQDWTDGGISSDGVVQEDVPTSGMPPEVTPNGFPADPAVPVPADPTVPPWPPLRPTAEDLADPAIVEPAAIDLDPGNQPISPVMAQAMEDQIQTLMGRLESALLMTESAQVSPELVLAAATDKQGQADAIPLLHPALGDAQQFLSDWPHLLAEDDYATARRRWQEVRDLLWATFPTDQPYAPAEIRAAWLDRGTIVAARSPEGLAEVFDQLAAAGITTVFFETVNAGYPIYPSQVAPASNPLIFRWDPLAAAVELAHARGMDLHAWVWVFAAGNERHNALVNLPLDYPGPVLSAHPDWAGYDNEGNRVPLGQDKPFLDPANPEVRSYLTQLMTEITTEYAVDGLHLDYIRYPFQSPSRDRTYGYGEAARWRFMRQTGVDPLDLRPYPEAGATYAVRSRQRQLWDSWNNFRIEQVTSFVSTLSTTLKRRRPELILSAAVFAKPEYERLQNIQQDWGTWAREGYVDWIVLMSYAGDTSRFEQLIHPWLLEADLGDTVVIPGIRLLDLPQAAALDQIQVTRDLPTPGYALFAVADLNSDLTTVLGTTQGSAPGSPSQNAPSPYRLAARRFEELRREWHWLLQQDRLWMDQDRLASWVTDANALGAQLDGLADDPSLRQLTTARRYLSTVRSALTDPILIDTANGDYRLQAWHHRLTTIEQLLAMGEQATQP